MLVAFSQLPDSRNLCRSAIMDLAALGTSSSSISTQAPALLLMLFHDGPVLPAEVWMPLLPLLDYLSQFSEQAVELGTRLRSLASGGFWTANQNRPGRATGHLTHPRKSRNKQKRIPVAILTIKGRRETQGSKEPQGQALVTLVAELFPDGQSAKWTDAGSVSHFSDRARRNLEPM
jgi:hypothetical protein